MTRYGISVRDVMKNNHLLVNPSDSIQKIAELMHKEDTSGAIVIDKTKTPIGVVTLKDLVYKGVMGGHNPKKTKISVLMSKDLVTIEPEEDLGKAVEIMSEHNISRLPVVKNKNLKGCISKTDVSNISPKLMDVLIEKLKVFKPSFKFGE